MSYLLFSNIYFVKKKKKFKYLNFNLKVSFLSEKNRTNVLYCFRSNLCMYKMFVIQLFPNNSISLFTSIILEYLTNMDWRDSVMLGLLGFFFEKLLLRFLNDFIWKKLVVFFFFFKYSLVFPIILLHISRHFTKKPWRRSLLYEISMCISNLHNCHNIVPTTRKVVPSSFSWTAVVVFVWSSVLI